MKKNLIMIMLTVIVTFTVCGFTFDYIDRDYDRACEEQFEILKDYWDYEYDEAGNLVFYDDYRMKSYTFREVAGGDWDLTQLRDLVEVAKYEWRYVD